MENNRLTVLAFFIIAFSIGMDLHHTNAIEVLAERQIDAQTDDALKTYEVQVVWVRKGAIGGGAFPSFPDTDYDSGTILVKTKTWPDSSSVANQAVPPEPEYKLDRIVSIRKLK